MPRSTISSHRRSIGARSTGPGGIGTRFGSPPRDGVRGAWTPLRGRLGPRSRLGTATVPRSRVQLPRRWAASVGAVVFAGGAGGRGSGPMMQGRGRGRPSAERGVVPPGPDETLRGVRKASPQGSPPRSSASKPSARPLSCGLPGPVRAARTPAAAIRSRAAVNGELKAVARPDVPQARPGTPRPPNGPGRDLGPVGCVGAAAGVDGRHLAGERARDARSGPDLTTIMGASWVRPRTTSWRTVWPGRSGPGRMHDPWPGRFLGTAVALRAAGCAGRASRPPPIRHHPSGPTQRSGVPAAAAAARGDGEPDAAGRRPRLVGVPAAPGAASSAAGSGCGARGAARPRAPLSPGPPSRAGARD